MQPKDIVAFAKEEYGIDITVSRVKTVVKKIKEAIGGADAQGFAALEGLLESLSEVNPRSTYRVEKDSANR